MTSILNTSLQKLLLELARKSILHGLTHGRSLQVNPGDYPPFFQEWGAAFVTIEKHGKLRGCIGTAEAYRPLVQDVVEHAYNAAFEDPRFKALNQNEFDLLHIEISILTNPEDITFSSESDFLEQVVPGKDGLILEDGYRRSLFLPAVWEKLPDTESFLSHLKQKAGLPAQHWSSTIKFQRFYSFEFSD